MEIRDFQRMEELVWFLIPKYKFLTKTLKELKKSYIRAHSENGSLINSINSIQNDLKLMGKSIGSFKNYSNKIRFKQAILEKEKVDLIHYIRQAEQNFLQANVGVENFLKSYRPSHMDWPIIESEISSFHKIMDQTSKYFEGQQEFLGMLQNN